MFGCDDMGGADGIVFAFTPYQGMTGYQGEGMGFAGLRPSLGLEIDTWKKQAEFKARRDPNFCPKCRDVALTTVQDLHSATKISLCTRCKGTWLSTGQFLNLINALLDEANQKSAPEIVKICLQQAKEMLTRPDSVISEWEDLKTVLELLKHRIFIQYPKLKSLIVLCPIVV